MFLKFWLMLSFLIIKLNLTKAANYLRPDVFTYNTKEPNWTRPPHDRIVICALLFYGGNLTGGDNESIDYSQCTHVVYRLLDYKNETALTTLQKRDEPAEHDENNIAKVINIRKRFSHLRALCEVRVYGNREEYLFSDYKKRLAMAKTIIKFMTKYKFDGIVLYLTMHRTIPADYLKRSDDLFDLIKIISNKLWKREFLLILKVLNYNQRVLMAYKFRRIVEYVDFLQVHMYEMDGTIKALLPLYGTDKYDEYCLDYQIRTLILLGVPMNRVLVHFEFGSYLLTTYDERTIHIGFSKYGANLGFWKKDDMCRVVINTPYNLNWNGVSHSPFAFSYERKRVIVYETPRSLIHKIRFAMKFNVRGFYLHGMNLDHLQGECPGAMFIDKYQDIEYDFQDLKNNVNILKAVPLLNFPNETTLKSRHREWPQMYIKKDKTLDLFTPKNESMKQYLLRSVTTGIVYAQQELALEDILRKKKQPQGSRMLWRDEVWQMFGKEN